jgi:hypothetical protein
MLQKDFNANKRYQCFAGGAEDGGIQEPKGEDETASSSSHLENSNLFS